MRLPPLSPLRIVPATGADYYVVLDAMDRPFAQGTYELCERSLAQLTIPPPPY